MHVRVILQRGVKLLGAIRPDMPDGLGASQELTKSLLCICRGLCTDRLRMVPLRRPVMYYDSVLVSMPGDVFVSDNLVVGRDTFTEFRRYWD